MKKFLTLCCALLGFGAMASAIQTAPEGGPTNVTNSPAVEVDGTDVWNSTGYGLIPLYEGYQTVVTFTNTPFTASNDNWSNFIIETPCVEAEFYGVTLRADNWGWSYYNLADAETATPALSTYDGVNEIPVAGTWPSTTITWTDWDAWAANTAAGETTLTVLTNANVLTFVVTFHDGEQEVYKVYYPSETVPIDGFYLGASGGKIAIETIEYLATYTGNVTGADGWWEQTDLGETDLFGTIDPVDATYIEFTEANGNDFTIAYNVVDETSETGTSWLSYTYANEAVNGVMTVNVSDIFWDESNYVMSIVFTAGTSNTLDVSWTVYTTALPANTHTTAIKEVKIADVDAVEVARYNLAGQKIAGEQKGINIVVYSDGSSKKVLVK